MSTRDRKHYALGFRADVEGLRAVAILLVVAAHARISGLAGGFVGVDVFFVLSGYLITGLLLREAGRDHRIHFRTFYARRLRRLLPALLLMLLVTGVAAALLMAPGELLNQYQASAAAAAWLSNLYFTFANVGYFSPGAASNIYLHTWSLGVEEQFYLVWPLLISIVLGFWSKRRSPPSMERLRWVMAGVLLVSLAASVFWTYRAPHFAFYMMPSRAWQFALGALVFLRFGAPETASDGSARAGVDAVSSSLPTLLAGWLGLALVLMSAVLLSPALAYPGFWALAPSVGAALILGAGAKSTRNGVGRLLSTRPMVGLGRLSYGWYLWHWPVLLLGATLVLHDTLGYRLLLAGLSLLLAAISFWSIERPIRRARIVVARPGMAIVMGLALIVLANTAAIRTYNYQRQRLQQPAQLKYEKARFDAPVIYTMDCDDWYHSSTVRICAFGDKHAHHTAVAFGDSVALQWFPAYFEIFNRPDWRLLVITKSSCPVVDEPIFYQRIGRIYTECSAWRKTAIADIRQLHPDIVIMGSTYSYAFDRTKWIDGTRNILAALTPKAGHVYIMRSTPILPFNGPSCLAPRSGLYKALSERSVCNARDHPKHSQQVFAWLKSAAAPFHNASVIDMSDAICPGGVCRAERDGMVVFRDQQHMTASFARSLTRRLQAKLHQYRAAVDTKAQHVVDQNAMTRAH